MMKKKRSGFYFLSALTLFLLLLAGCGGDESYISKSSTTATVPFRGVVEDGPIAGAKISLRDKDGTYYPLYDSLGHENYEVRTDENGAFALAVKADLDVSHLSVHAVGGIDMATGLDFKKLEMRSPLALFHGDVTAMVVSPLTTLVAELHDQGLSFEDAENRLRAWLAVDADLAAAPHTNLVLQCRTLLLSKMALEMKAAQPFHAISVKIAPDTSLMQKDEDRDYSCDPLILSTLGLTDLAVERISDLQELLKKLNPETNTPADAFYIFKSEEINHLYDDNFREMLALVPPFDGNYQDNLDILTEKTLLSAGDEVILLVDPIPSRLFRYVYFTYFVAKQTVLDPVPNKRLEMIMTLARDWLASAEFSESLTYVENSGRVVALEYDPWINLLASSRSPNSVDSPLPWNDLLGNDNQRRLAYFYESDISPHFLAEQLIGRVFDDKINDAVLLKIIEGKANFNLIDEALAIIDTQIVQSEPKANAHRAVANALIKFNRKEEACNALDLARDLYRFVIKQKGAASATSTDFDNLIATSNSYRKAGDLDNAKNLLAEVTGMLKSVTSYGNLIAGLKKLIDNYIAVGDLDEARLQAESMYYYSSQTPESAPGNYMLRVLNLKDCAKRYAVLNNRMKVLQIFSEIQLLRETYKTTETLTWSYIPDLVEILYRIEEKEKALVLANAIPITSMTGPTSNRSTAFSRISTYEALHGNLETAFSIANNITKDDDRVDLLTYFAGNREVPYVALALINVGRYDEARQALIKAEILLGGAGMSQSSNLAKIRYGFVKVAELYALMGDLDKAEYLLDSAQKSIVDDVYRAASMVDIALGYYNLKQQDTALTFLSSAHSIAEGDPTLYRVGLTPIPSNTEDTAALLYEMFIKAYEKIDEKSLLHINVINSFLTRSENIYTGTVPGSNDALAMKECDYLLRGALYLDRVGSHRDALVAIAAAKKSAAQIADPPKRFTKYLKVITTYAAVYEDKLGLNDAESFPHKPDRDQAIQSLANAYIDRDAFPTSDVANIDSDGDGKPNFFHPLATTEDIAASGLILDDDSDGDGIIDTLDIRPLFKD